MMIGAASLVRGHSVEFIPLGISLMSGGEFILLLNSFIAIFTTGPVGRESVLDRGVIASVSLLVLYGPADLNTLVAQQPSTQVPP